MRYLRKETAFLLDGKILIPECISRISGFSKGMTRIAYLSIAANAIVISLTLINSGTANIVAAIDKANILTIPQAAMNRAGFVATKAVTIYLLDHNTIEIFPQDISDTYYRDSEATGSKSQPPKFADDFFIIENKTEIAKVRLSDIYYFEKIKGTHNTCIVFAGGISTFKMDLHEVLAGLDGAFIQCHKAFIANMTNVKRIEKYPSYCILHFPNNHSCPCSILYRKAVTKWTY